MRSEAKKHREPLIHITKRAEMVWWKGWLIRGLAIVAAMIVAGAAIMLLTGLNPVSVYAKMLEGNFSTSRRLWMLLQKTAILLCIALAVTPAFKMKFWNCGGEGQTLAGCIAAAACMIYLGDSMPNILLIPITLVMSIFAGAVVGVIPAVFKAKYNTNETLFTLMMNYVIIQMVEVLEVLWENPKNSGNVGIINRQTESGWLPALFGQQYLLIILIVAVVCVLVYIYLKYSKQGYEVAVVGESQNTARYIGINVKKVIVRTMLVSGALCGIAGFLLVSGTGHTIGPNTVGGQGFTAMMVSWMAKFNPLTMVLTSALIIFLQQGSTAIATSFRLNSSLADIVTGIILFFIIGCEFFIQYQVKFRRSRKEREE